MPQGIWLGNLDDDQNIAKFLCTSSQSTGTKVEREERKALPKGDLMRRALVSSTQELLTQQGFHCITR
jgi:DNA-binding transcriptional regulator YbjK